MRFANQQLTSRVRTHCGFGGFGARALFQSARITLAALLISLVTGSAAQFTPEQIDFFEKEVRPILVENCHKCHSTRSEKIKGGLLLDSRDGVIKGGEDGLVVQPGDPEKSKLIEAIGYQNPELQMPPKGKLRQDQIAALTTWIKMGLPWPAGDAPVLATQNPTNAFDLDKRRREHWAWQPINPAHPPTVRDRNWPATPVDSFLLARLEQAGLSPAPRADRRTLIRRLYFDLLGLPPSAAVIQEFLNDSSSAAYEKLVDRLLASPQFGERWGRHWLDLVRYAETLGHEFDYPIHNAWRYRDYVIRALNADVPYDQFVTEQIAGDLLTHPRLHPTEHFNESVIGTGFFWLGQRDHSPVDVRQHQAELIDNQIDVLCKTFLGLTVACARCHDHKFDAISARDYYALYGVLESSRYTQKAIAPAPLPQIKALEQLKTKIRLAAIADWSRQTDQIPRRLRNARFNPQPNDFLYPWARLSALAQASGPEFKEQWNSLLRQAHGVSGANPQMVSDPPAGCFADWFPDGEAFWPPARAEPSFLVEDSTLTILSQPAQDTRLISRRLEGCLRSPGFFITNSYLHILAAGRDSRIRVCVDNLTMIRDPIYGGLMVHLNQDQPAWLTFDLRMWQGHRAFVELSDTTVPDPADEERKAGYGNAGWLSARRIVFSNEPAPGLEAGGPLWLELLGSQPPESLADLEVRYRNAFIRALKLWKSQPAILSANDRAHLAFLDWAVKHWLLPPPELPAPASSSTDSGLLHVIAEYHRLESLIPAPTRVPAMADGDGFDEHVFIRGNHNSLGAPAPRQFLTALSSGSSAPFKCGSGRLELARCMTAASNPLLARVMVNRVWLHLFGRGLVPTPDDFGKLGQPPSHPELLDWLAAWYRTDAHWSTKKLIRLLVMSSAYRMSSQPADALAEQKDPPNLLFHRMTIKRLEGETIRDAMLAISGRLDLNMFGPPVRTHLTEFMDGRGRPATSGPLDGQGRRSIYLEVRRNFLAPMMRTFDTPVPFTTIGKRTVSNVPAQSLILMNDPFVISQARFWARRALAEAQVPFDQRIVRLYEMAFAREPTDRERAKALAFLRQQANAYGLSSEQWERDENVWADLCHVLFNVKEFIFLE